MPSAIRRYRALWLGVLFLAVLGVVFWWLSRQVKTAPGTPPTLSAELPAEIPAGVEFTRVLTVGGMPAPQLSVKNGPPGLTVNNDGLLTWPDPAPGSYEMTFEASNPHGVATLPWRVKVVAQPVQIVKDPELTAKPGEDYDSPIIVSGTPPFTWSVKDAAPELTFDKLGETRDTTCHVYIPKDKLKPGQTYSFTVTISNLSGEAAASVTKTYQIVCKEQQKPEQQPQQQPTKSVKIASVSVEQPKTEPPKEEPPKEEPPPPAPTPPPAAEPDQQRLQKEAERLAQEKQRLAEEKRQQEEAEKQRQEAEKQRQAQAEAARQQAEEAKRQAEALEKQRQAEAARQEALEKQRLAEEKARLEAEQKRQEEIRQQLAAAEKAREEEKRRQAEAAARAEEARQQQLKALAEQQEALKREQEKQRREELAAEQKRLAEEAERLRQEKERQAKAQAALEAQRQAELQRQREEQARLAKEMEARRQQQEALAKQQAELAAKKEEEARLAAEKARLAAEAQRQAEVRRQAELAAQQQAEKARQDALEQAARERAEQERQRAEQETQRQAQEQQRVEQLVAKGRAVELERYDLQSGNADFATFLTRARNAGLKVVFTNLHAMLPNSGRSQFEVVSTDSSGRPVLRQIQGLTADALRASRYTTKNILVKDVPSPNGWRNLDDYLRARWQQPSDYQMIAFFPLQLLGLLEETATQYYAAHAIDAGIPYAKGAGTVVFSLSARGGIEIISMNNTR